MVRTSEDDTVLHAHNIHELDEYKELCSLTKLHNAQLSSLELLWWILLLLFLLYVFISVAMQSVQVVAMLDCIESVGKKIKFATATFFATAVANGVALYQTADQLATIDVALCQIGSPPDGLGPEILRVFKASPWKKKVPSHLKFLSHPLSFWGVVDLCIVLVKFLLILAL